MLFTAILLKSLISCIIKQPVYISQSGCDGSVRVCLSVCARVCVCVLLLGLVFTSMMLWLSGIQVVGHYGALKQRQASL